MIHFSCPSRGFSPTGNRIASLTTLRSSNGTRASTPPCRCDQSVAAPPAGPFDDREGALAAQPGDIASPQCRYPASTISVSLGLWAKTHGDPARGFQTAISAS